MIQVFFGYRNVMEHVIKRVPRADGRGTHEVEAFAEDVQAWCDANLNGPAELIYVHFKREDPDEPGTMRTYGRYEFLFDGERDASLFKLFWIGAEHQKRG